MSLYWVNLQLIIGTKLITILSISQAVLKPQTTQKTNRQADINMWQVPDINMWGVLRYISDGEVRSPLLGLKLAIWDFF